ncbi:MAG: hypothetical protein MUE85_06805 [Microscillaceae bacterium]|jgi:hypothetical protein|nr:hypothetical protein [Microscillaceae bacterium]
MQIQVLDLNKKPRVFDDIEPNDYYQMIEFPNYPAWNFSLAEIYNQPFGHLVNVVGNELLTQIIDSQGIKIPQTEWETYRGGDNLPLYYYLRSGKTSDYQLLIIVSSGEFQPARYIANIEAVWEIKQA